MPELRRDPVVGYWTIISTERSRRPVEVKPNAFIEEGLCPFCEGHEAQTPPEVYAFRKPGTHPDSPGWNVRVVPSKMPILSDQCPLERYGHGLYDLMTGVGKHEVIIETPKHNNDLDELSVEEVEKVVQVYARRMTELEQDPRFKYTLLFKNHGLASGTSEAAIRHAHSQMIATPITPKRVKEELLATKSYFDRKERCVVCDIVKQETAQGGRVISQNRSFFAFCPFASRAPFEIWIVPKRHHADFARMAPGDSGGFAALLKECLSKLKILLNDPPYNFILHTAPFRHKKKESYWKTIEEDYHWYLYIAPKLTHNAGFEWGTGIHINPTPPEDAALLLRETEVRNAAIT